MAAIIGAIIAASLQSPSNHQSPVSNNGTPPSAQTSTTTPIDTDQSTTATTAASPSPTQPIVSTTPAPKPSPTLTPHGQPGYTLIEYGTFTIGLAGIDFSTAGWRKGTGGEEDLQYQGDGNWGNQDATGYWKSSDSPTPGDCDGLINAQNVIVVSGMPKVGDRYCAVQPIGTLLAYMQVTKVNTSGVHVVAWLWDQNG